MKCGNRPWLKETSTETFMKANMNTRDQLEAPSRRWMMIDIATAWRLIATRMSLVHRRIKDSGEIATSKVCTVGFEQAKQ